jgi:hypothetical protein
MRRPVAFQTTEAGLGLSLMGQSGMGGGGGVCATGAGSGFFGVWCACGLCEVDFDVAGWAGDCALLLIVPRKTHVRTAVARNRDGNREEGMKRSGGAEIVRMGISPLTLCGRAGKFLTRPTALDYQWPSNAHRDFIAGLKTG